MAKICQPHFQYIAEWLTKAWFCHISSLYGLVDQLRHSDKGYLVGTRKLRPVIPFLLLGVALWVSPFLCSQSQASSFEHEALEMDISDKLCDPLGSRRKICWSRKDSCAYRPSYWRRRYRRSGSVAQWHRYWSLDYWFRRGRWFTKRASWRRDGWSRQYDKSSPGRPSRFWDHV